MAKKKNEPLRLDILKTYKLYIGGSFPRTESGRYFPLLDAESGLVANMCRASRKDFRNAVVAARKAQSTWAGRTAYNRSQILYRIAEMLEGRKAQFSNELEQIGFKPVEAESNILKSIDRLVYYAGWADKFQQLSSSVNPVAAPYFNFSVPEPMGVVSVLIPEDEGLLGLISTVIPAITGGNSCVMLAQGNASLAAVSFAEVLHTSDLPGGVINILTGFQSELTDHFASHMDVNALVYAGSDQELLISLHEKATDNLKRLIHYDTDWDEEGAQGLHFITDLQEIKTTWHPVGK